MDYLLSVAHHSYIRVVGYDEYLPPLLCLFNTGSEKPRNSLIVEILFRLIKDQRYIALVYQKIEDEQKRSSFSWRQLV